MNDKPSSEGSSTTKGAHHTAGGKSPHASPSATGSATSGGGSTNQTKDTITLGFAGDIHFANQLAPRLRHPDTALKPIAPALRKPDLTMVNLETAITQRGKPEPKQFHFRTKPAALKALDAGGADVVTMANNHAVDYGKRGLTDTLAAKKDSPVPVAGIGKNADAAFRPVIKKTHGTRVAFLAATTLSDRTGRAWAAGKHKAGVAYARNPEPRLVKQVREAKKHADVVVVYLHWGEERNPCPIPRQKKHAKALAAAGANVVVGSHAHVLQGGGWRGDTYIDYGFGNFVWYNQNPKPDTGVLTLTLRNGKVTKDSLTPARIGSDGLPRPRSGAQKKQARKKWQNLNRCTHLSSHPPH